MRKPIDAAALATMVALCLTWGLQQVAIKAIAGEVDPALQVGLRSAVAALAVWLLSRWVLRDRWLPGQNRSGLLVGSLFGLEFLLVAEGLRLTSAAHIVVFLYTSPIFAAIGLHLTLAQERLVRLQWLGIAMAFGGVAFIFIAPELLSQGGGLSHEMLIGDALGLCAGAAWGLTTVSIRKSGLSDAPPAQTLFYQLAMAALMALVFAVIRGRFDFHGGPLVWANLTFQTLIVSVASYLLWFRLLRHYLASRLGVLSFMTPVFGVVFGALLLGERVDATFLMGSILVLGGMLFVNGREWLSSWRLRRGYRGDVATAEKAVEPT